MQMFLQIHFTFHAQKSENSFWWNFGKDFIVPIGIAVLAAAVAYFIFIKETRRDKLNEDRKKDEERSDKLLFFSSVIDSCLSVGTQQKDYIKKYIRQIKQNDVDFHLMTFLPLNDLIRVSTVLNLEDYLLAYVNKYPSDRKSSIKEFKEIIASVDYLLEIYKQIPEQLKKAQTYDYERKLKFQTLFQNAYNLTGRVTMGLQGNQVIFQRLIQLYNNFTENHPGNNYDINFYYNHFFVPYNNFCTEYLGAGNQPFQELLELALLTRDGKQLFEHIKSEHQILRGELTDDFKRIYRALLDLKSNAKNLPKIKR